MMSRYISIVTTFFIAVVLFSFKNGSQSDVYQSAYYKNIRDFKNAQQKLMAVIQNSNLRAEKDIEQIKSEILVARKEMKGIDFWFRYFEPVAYKKIHGPLPVEWETEVFEKFEKPYKRDCAGLTLAELYLDEEQPAKDSLLSLIRMAYTAADVYTADSITTNLTDYSHFYLCNRLYLLNMAAIYTTGFECPNTEAVVQELRDMMVDVKDIYLAFNQSFPDTKLTDEYLALYDNTMAFVNAQPNDPTQFDHYTFIKDYLNPLYLQNQQLINKYKVVSKNLIDYSLSKKEITIFDKSIYYGQDEKGIFRRVTDPKDLAEIDRIGKMLFYDPLLSGNNMRSCASCHKPTEFFTDTTSATAFQFNHTDYLPRNTPTLINAPFNHLMMADGRHYTMQHQARDVISNPLEMACDEKEMLKKVLSCDEYKKAFTKLLKYTPQEPEISMEHVASVLTAYYSRFSKYTAPFDEAMNGRQALSEHAKNGFNLFMSKAQCATCHFVPQFNGVKPPYIGSEFEVLGVPADKAYTKLSEDKGRYSVNPAHETSRAFRTGTIRNAAYTKPYMHNGVFTTLEEVMDFYDTGGGAGHGLTLENQTLSADSLKLTKQEKSDVIAFIESLNENIIFEKAPERLPKSSIKALNQRKVGGVY